MKSFINFQLNLWKIFLGIIALFNILWVVVILMFYLDTGIFNLGILIIGLVFSTIIGYLLFLIPCIIAFVSSDAASFRVQLFFKKPIFHIIAVVVLFVILAIYSIFYDSSNYDRDLIVSILNFDWVIFGINITVFIFSYAFITVRLEKRKNEKCDDDKGNPLRKTNYNNEIQSKYATFYFILTDAFILIYASSIILISKNPNNITDFNFDVLIISFFFSTNTLVLVLMDVFKEIKNKKEELAFSDALIKQEGEEIIDIFKRSKVAKAIFKNTNTLMSNDITLTKIDNIINKISNSELSQKKNKKKMLKFLKTTMNLISIRKEYVELFEKMQTKIGEKKFESLVSLMEILSIQKQMLKKQKKNNKIVRKLDRFKL